MIAPSIGEFAKAAAAAKSILEMIQRQPNIDPLGQDGERPESLDGHISLRGVSFAYPARPTLKVLDIGDGENGIDFEAGKITAIVGASGSGKSTIVGLIERWYDPQEGQILLDGIDIKRLNVRWLRSQIGFVQQVSDRPRIPTRGLHLIQRLRNLSSSVIRYTTTCELLHPLQSTSRCRPEGRL